MQHQIEDHQASALNWDEIMRAQRSENESLTTELEINKKEIQNLNKQIETLTASIKNDELETIQNDLTAKIEEIKLLQLRISDFKEKEVELQTMIDSNTARLETRDLEMEELKKACTQKNEALAEERGKWLFICKRLFKITASRKFKGNV